MRSIGVLRGTALYVAAIVGPGILTLPALAAHEAGPGSLIALALILLLSVPIAFTFAAIEQIAPGTGGVAAYASRAFGRRMGLVVGNWFYLGVPIGVPALGLIGGSYVASALGMGRIVVIGVASAIVAVAVCANVFARPGSHKLTLILTAALVVMVMASAALTISHWNGRNLTPLAPNGWVAVGRSSLLLVWVLTGWEAVTNFSGRLRDPHRTLRRVTRWTIVIVIALYASIAIPEILVLGGHGGDSDAPLVALLRVSVAPASLVVAVLAVIVALNNATAYVGSLAELGVALRGTPYDTSTSTLRSRSRALLVPVLIMIVGLVLAAVAGANTGTLVSICVGSQVPVYLAGVGSGIVLIKRWTRHWWLALLSTAGVSVLLIPAAVYLLIPALIAVWVLTGSIARARAGGHGFMRAGAR